ncbi:hypothetical protein GCM10015535_56130 [Streptomyces gelaticus]|uniref:Secreted protein n=1 Tax=Streptomyces gelaticus TaxID=285446 RepID=A0ABQ2W8F4_9ACTN|nr:hypothetical protein [Streptomyces gelaticus]GGV93340.1 hypothetical protein GCM10015535_56130 [Streptomyces gelaticus]
MPQQRPTQTPRPVAQPGPTPPPPQEREPRGTTLRQRLAELRGPAVPPRPLDARALAALAANPGCRRRALLDGAGVDKAALAAALGSPAPFGQSQFALVRGNAFEAKVKADGGTELMRLLYERLGGDAGAPREVSVPDLTAAGPEGRAARTALALREATEAGGWALLDHPMLALEVAGSPAYLEPDAVAVHPDGTWTVVEIKSFPTVDGSADAAKVGAAARQSAVYVLALERIAELTEGAEVGHRVLLVCPKDFSNLPTASVVDVRKQRAVTRRQLTRLTRIEEIAAALPEGTTFDPQCPRQQLDAAVESVGAAYAPECLAACELAFHCRAKAREAGAVETLGRSVRGELGGLTTVGEVLAAAAGKEGDPADPTVAALRRAAALRAEALAGGPACR